LGARNKHSAKLTECMWGGVRGPRAGQLTIGGRVAVSGRRISNRSDLENSIKFGSGDSLLKKDGVGCRGEEGPDLMEHGKK